MVPSLPDRLPTIFLVALLWQHTHGWGGKADRQLGGGATLPPPHLAPGDTYFFGASRPSRIGDQRE